MELEVLKQFKAPKKSLGDLDAEAAATLIAAAADVALIIDAKGVIRDIAFGNDELPKEGYDQWLGQPWINTVTPESRLKIEAMLAQAASKATLKARQVNHPSPSGVDVPILYSAVGIGREGRIVAVGRDLRVIASLQQRLLETQQSMERDYSRLRHAETRYRLLFQIASEAVLIVDANSQKIIEANPAATRLLSVGTRNVVGRAFPEGLDAQGLRAVQNLFAGLRAAGRADDVQVGLVNGARNVTVSASVFRQDDAMFFLVRLSPLEADGATSALAEPRSRLIEVVESSPDGFVVTDPDGLVLTANRAFLEMAQIGAEEQARGESLERWLGRRGVDLNVLLANLRQHGSVRLFATSLRGEYGSTADVEISAVSVAGEHPCVGFTIRHVGRRVAPATPTAKELPRSVEQLTELIGRVSLKDLVRETTDVIERMCIEAALEMTGDNRASAAEMLGLSRQSLYVKLRRYGLGDLDAADEPH